MRSFDIQKPPPPQPPHQEVIKPVVTTPPPTIPTFSMTSKFKKRRRGPFIIIVFGLILILAATMGGLYLFGPKHSQSGGVSLAITGPNNITAGDEVSYLITIDNREDDLVVADLTLEYPAGFLVSTTDPQSANQGKSLFHLGPILAGQQRQVVVTGYLVGLANSKADLRARLDYQPQNFNSSFHVETGYLTSIIASRVKLNIQAPAEVMPQGSLIVDISLINTSDITLNNLEIVVEMPGEFTLTSTTPNFVTTTTNEQKWVITTLSSGSEWLGKISGEIMGDLNKKSSLIIAVYQRNNQQRQPLDRALVEFTIVQPQADLTLEVAGSSSQTNVDWGTKVPVVMRYHGSSTTALLNNVLKLRIEGEAVDWDNIEDPYGGHRDGQFWVWDSTSNIANYLQRIEQNSEGIWRLVVPIVSQSTVNPTVKLVAILQPGNFSNDYQAIAGPVVLHIGEGLAVSRAGQYVSGSLPPKVDQQTSYKITWQLQRPSQSVNQVTWSANVPDNVVIDISHAQVDQGSLTKDGKKLIWNVGVLGTGGSTLQAVFTATLTPNAEQVDGPALIMGATTITGQQAGQALTSRLDLLTTTMGGDSSVNGQWNVVGE